MSHPVNTLRPLYNCLPGPAVKGKMAIWTILTVPAPYPGLTWKVVRHDAHSSLELATPAALPDTTSYSTA